MSNRPMFDPAAVAPQAMAAMAGDPFAIVAEVREAIARERVVVVDYELGRGFAMVRKQGKLPGRTVRYTYDLEYGTDTSEIQEDAIVAGQRVVVLDDLVATGGTMQAAIDLVRQRSGEVVAAGCIIELSFLGGRDRIDVPFTSMVAYDS
jgi:adenine phosphoribosyltransferase